MKRKRRRRQREKPKKPRETLTGTISVHPRGFGFVQIDEDFGHAADIFIPKHRTHHAVDGDRVEVSVNSESASEKGPEGSVVAILERARKHVAGIIKSIERDGRAVAHVPLLGKKRRVVVEEEGSSLRSGDRVIMEVLDWGEDKKEALCRLSHKLGHIDDPSCDVEAAIEEYELRADFPLEVLREAESFGQRVSQKAFEGREDLRHLETFTIDPDSAKDFDDALSLKRDKRGGFHLWVHIADVTHYVQPGSALDREAELRCNSTYFPNRCVPMLPEALSNNLCSLKPRVNRLTVTVFMRFDREGSLLEHRIFRSVIKSRRRFTYRQAKSVLDGQKPSPYRKTLQQMAALCSLLKKKRAERGGIEFSLPELAILVDERGEPIGTDYVEYDITHQLVEEFMLKANEVVARHLTDQGKGAAYRVHEEPSEEDLKDFVLLAAAFGHKLSDKPSVSELQQLFEELQHSPYGPYLASSFIRRMRMATYSPDNIGHYGLALTHYCHFTSPIRRYADIAIHRLLFGQESDSEALQQIGIACSERERVSSRAENSVILLKKLRLLKKMSEEEPGRSFEAIVTRIKPFGFFFELLEVMVEGYLHLSDLQSDFFIYDEKRMRLKGRRTGKVYKPTSKLFVCLERIDLINQETNWYLLPD